jgi:hypothetical protein
MAVQPGFFDRAGRLKTLSAAGAAAATGAGHRFRSVPGGSGSGAGALGSTPLKSGIRGVIKTHPLSPPKPAPAERASVAAVRKEKRAKPLAIALACGRERKAG